MADAHARGRDAKAKAAQMRQLPGCGQGQRHPIGRARRPQPQRHVPPAPPRGRQLEKMIEQAIFAGRDVQELRLPPGGTGQGALRRGMEFRRGQQDHPPDPRPRPGNGFQRDTRAQGMRKKVNAAVRRKRRDQVQHLRQLVSRRAGPAIPRPQPQRPIPCERQAQAFVGPPAAKAQFAGPTDGFPAIGPLPQPENMAVRVMITRKRGITQPMQQDHDGRFAGQVRQSLGQGCGQIAVPRRQGGAVRAGIDAD